LPQNHANFHTKNTVGSTIIQKPSTWGFSDMLVGYMRVSSDNNRQTTDLQRDALIQAGVDERHLYEDKASGARDDRPGLAQALKDVRSGDCLVVWKLDRLGRSLPHLIGIVADLQSREVAFRSLTEQMDTTTPHGEFLFSVFGALAQYERALTKERIMAGLEAAKRRGKRGGRPITISEETMDGIREALKNGASKAAVCRTFGVKRSTLYDALARGAGTM
jgi:DNA invertase Pin-like site-specific DNA recombinase